MARATRRGPSSLLIGLELALGVFLLGGAALGGILFEHRPGENRLDHFGFTVLPPEQNSHLWHEVALLGSLPALLIGIALAVAASIWRDPYRTFACAVGPVLAVLITEHIAKPLVGREVSAGGGFSYPSGTVTAIAALATVVLLASPPLFRPLATVLGAAAIAAVSVAVVAMRWHYPTDALGGACVGTGAVFTLDALVHLPPLWRARLRERRGARPLRPAHYLEHV